MPFCSNCGHELSADAKFCSNCGAPYGGEQSIGSQKRQQEYAGKIIKCPSCGELLSAFQSKCPSCGYEIREAKASTSVSEFVQKLELAKSNDQQIKLIRSFPIPNTKEDIFEFMILASTNVGHGLGKELSSAWRAKIEQAYQKAQLILEDDKDLSQFQHMYTQVYAKISKDTKIQAVKKAGTLLSELMPVFPNVVIVMGWLISLFILLPMCRINHDNVGTNAQQLLLITDLVAGAFLLPYVLKCESALPKLVASFGLILSIVVLIPLCNKNLDNVGTNAFQLILIVDVVCSVVILIKMFKYKSAYEGDSDSRTLNGVSFVIALICILLLLVVYWIGSIRISIAQTSSNIHSIGSNAKSNYQDDTELINWDSFVLGEHIPDFGYDEAEVVWDTDNVLILYFYNMDNSKFKSYIEECKDFGYNIDAEDSGANYTAYNQDGYYLHLQYLDFTDNKKLTIDLKDPIKNNQILWPNSKLVENLPKPKTLIGEVSTESSEAYAVYLTGMEPIYFSEYVTLCMDNGFNVDYSKSDTYFRAENKDGISLTGGIQGI